ncbi:MAG: hypothetical protein LLF98_14245 [Clostridium sp.]|uniref:hypothetical protein n=1 Tax=Clostridium sp. TaxID=1506 RepID=UPI0025BEAA49|nr:hypothetical protein [Clostridium sp.]MCE5222362.1 hypothetical protein [Clostridium sp.]
MKHKRKVEILIYKKRLKRFIFSKRKREKKRKKNRKIQGTDLSIFLNMHNFGKKINVHNNRRNRIIIPKNFSFIENPDETIDTLKKIHYLGDSKAEEIFFDHTKLQNLDISASTVMDTLIMDIIKKREKRKQNIGISGEYYSNDGKISAILEVSGILKHLGFKNTEPKNIEKLELIESQSSDDVSTEVVEYIDRCLKRQKLELTKRGRRYFSILVGEIIDNCELHGGEFSKWYTLGHYFNQEEYGECQLVIFNYGNTIYESLKRKDTTKEAKESLENMSNIHKLDYKNLFWNEESMWTLYALQDGVSRKRDKKHPDRGTGTVRFINSFQNIGCTVGGNYPKMSIISGNTCILFNNKYKLEDVDFGGKSRKIIAFNKENNLYKPPDRENVRILKNYFPGTVISMNFYIDEKYIEKIIKDDENERDKFKTMCKEW